MNSKSTYIGWVVAEGFNCESEDSHAKESLDRCESFLLMLGKGKGRDEVSEVTISRQFCDACCKRIQKIVEGAAHLSRTHAPWSLHHG